MPRRQTSKRKKKQARKPRETKPRSVEYDDPAVVEMVDLLVHEFRQCPFCHKELVDMIAIHLLDCEQFPAREEWRKAVQTVRRYRAEREAKAKAGIPEVKN